MLCGRNCRFFAVLGHKKKVTRAEQSRAED